MSLNGILSNATSGLMAAQAGLRTVSDNVANANTPGYVRKVVNQSSLVSMGAGAGVNIDGIQRVVDRYLESANLSASATVGKAGALSELLDRAQSLFGDPSNGDAYFDKLNDIYTQFAALADDSASALQRAQSLSAVQTFFDDTSRIAQSLDDIQQDADTRIRSAVGRANDLLTQITQLNADIRRANIGGADATGSENIQAQLLTELAGLVDIKVTQTTDGASVVLAPDGALLADREAAVISYTSSASASGYLTVVPAGAAGQSYDATFTSGEIVGLVSGRNGAIPDALAQLLEFTSNAAEQLNAAHNANSSVPAPADMTGKYTGLDLPTAVGGFTGQTTIALLNSSGVIQHRVAIDFSASTVSLDGGAAAAFTPATFQATVNAALGANGSMSFTNGAMSLHANSGGLAIVDDATAPSTKAGQGFSQFFGLNDLVRSSALNPDTGLQGSDAHGFTAGQQIVFRLAQDGGQRVRDVTFTIPAGTTMTNLVTALNTAGTGVAPSGTFALDANGRLGFTSASSPQVRLTVVSDATSRGAGGPGLSTFFGLGTAGAAAAASSFAVRPEIYQNPNLIAAAKVNLTAGAGVVALSVGDGRGALALAQAGEQTTNFGAAGDLPAALMSVTRYAREFSGSLGRKAAGAETALSSATAVQTEAQARLSSYEGVNMDEELIRLTQYQQAFNASARMITAANQMYDVLMAMI